METLLDLRRHYAYRLRPSLGAEATILIYRLTEWESIQFSSLELT